MENSKDQVVKTTKQQSSDQKLKDKINQKETKIEIRRIKSLKRQRSKEDKIVLKKELSVLENAFIENNESIKKDNDEELKKLNIEFKYKIKPIEVEQENLISKLESSFKLMSKTIEDDRKNELKRLSTSFSINSKSLDEKELEKYTNENNKEINSLNNKYDSKLNEESQKSNQEIDNLNKKYKEKIDIISRKNDEKINDLNKKYIEQSNTLKSKNVSNIKEIKITWKQKYKKGNWKNTEGKIVEVSALQKYYITPGIVTPVLKNLKLDINKGDIVAILGPSGSGKTTLLNLISGLDTAHGGDIVVADRNLIYLSDSDLTKFRAKNVSFIFQSYNLLPTLNVLENVKTGSQLQKDKDKKLEELVLLKKLGLYEERFKYPYQLSGGQQQRVSIARALAKNPSILFGDEPTGALDTETATQVLETLIKVNKDFKTTLVIVTHNPSIAKICNKVIRVKNGNVEKITVNPKPLLPSQIKWD